MSLATLARSEQLDSPMNMEPLGVQRLFKSRVRPFPNGPAIGADEHHRHSFVRRFVANHKIGVLSGQAPHDPKLNEQGERAINRRGSDGSAIISKALHQLIDSYRSIAGDQLFQHSAAARCQFHLHVFAKSLGISKQIRICSARTPQREPQLTMNDIRHLDLLILSAEAHLR
jgi:hypothetical protein